MKYFVKDKPEKLNDLITPFSKLWKFGVIKRNTFDFCIYKKSERWEKIKGRKLAFVSVKGGGGGLKLQ